MEITKSSGTIKQTVYSDATLKGTNVYLTGEATISKSGKVIQYVGQVYNSTNERIGDFSYSASSSPYMGQNGISIRLSDTGNMKYYVEASEVLSQGVSMLDI